MKRNLYKALVLISFPLLSLMLIAPNLVFGADTVAPTEYHLLAPIPQIVKSGNDVTDTATYLPGLVKLIIAIATGLAVLMIIFGGIKYMTSDAFQGKSDAKKTIMDAIWGLLLIIGAWTILYTINPKLLDFSLEIAQQESVDQVTPNISGPSSGDYSAGNQLPGPTAFGGLTQQQARDQLLAAGITTQGPILLEGVHQNVINEVISLKTSCSCDVVVNSATGGQHNDGIYSHANGYKVDLNDTTGLTNYITQNFTPTVTRGDGARQWISPTGVIYARESTHWDIVVK